MVTVSDLQRVAPILNIAALAEAAFAGADKVRASQNLRNKLRYNRELTVPESVAIEKVFHDLGLTIEHREPE